MFLPDSDAAKEEPAVPAKVRMQLDQRGFISGLITSICTAQKIDWK